MECRFKAMLVLWLGKEFYRDKYGMTVSGQAWNPDSGDELRDHFRESSICRQSHQICLQDSKMVAKFVEKVRDQGLAATRHFIFTPVKPSSHP
ncbi:hypothetical protein AVEN_237782-1 [Araneus ventricosus]|uniref:Uncharacterized protein n=1 Tax=Araneus ventricosus TaxID=182803 RepID=A0A4Y2NW57_ARAVE|nr:hypothetical protein AVEN_237782-1 [Araneus ventricosus]